MIFFHRNKSLKKLTVKAKRKRIGKSKIDEIEDVLIQWLKHARDHNVPISSVMKKAMEIAEELNIEDFGHSNTWLEHFKVRHCLSFKTIQRSSSC